MSFQCYELSRVHDGVQNFRLETVPRRYDMCPNKNRKKFEHLNMTMLLRTVPNVYFFLTKCRLPKFAGTVFNRALIHHATVTITLSVMSARFDKEMEVHSKLPCDLPVTCVRRDSICDLLNCKFAELYNLVETRIHPVSSAATQRLTVFIATFG